ncbi:MAG: hypothetical protein WCA46_24770, partial [Actinocatenispora sp.]
MTRRLSDEAEPFAAQVRADPDFRAELRARLMADAELHGVGANRVDSEEDAAAPAPTSHALAGGYRRVLAQG